MASNTAKVTGAAAGGAAVITALALLTGGPKAGYVQMCTQAATTDGSVKCPARSWGEPSADSFVLSGTKKDTSVWGNADYKFRKYSTLRLIDYIEVCNKAITAGAFTTVDPCGNTTEFKKPIVVAYYKKLVPPNGALLSWEPVTQNTDASAVKTPVTYTLYRGPKLGDTIDKTKRVKVFEVTAPPDNFRIIAGQPIGEQWYAMTAKDKDAVESDQTNAISKVMKLQGPSSVGLDPPTNSGVE